MTRLAAHFDFQLGPVKASGARQHGISIGNDDASSTTQSAFTLLEKNPR
jgi:hypothetical protein